MAYPCHMYLTCPMCLVPRKTFLMPHVLAGNVPHVEAILNQLSGQVTRDDVMEAKADGVCNGNGNSHSSPKQGKDGSKRPHSNPKCGEGPSKRMKIDLTASNGPHLFVSVEEEPTLNHTHTCDVPLDSLLERTAGNASVLHICCQLDPSEEGYMLSEGQDAKLKAYRGMLDWGRGVSEVKHPIPLNWRTSFVWVN